MKVAFFIISAFVCITSTTAADGNNTMSTNSMEAGLLGLDCYPRQPDGLDFWYYNSKAEGPYDCTLNHDGKTSWSMLNAYRSGGAEGVHWKYTDNVNDGECLKDWKYYSSDGQTQLAKISGRTTTMDSSRRWCALPVYRPGGVVFKQWDRCTCSSDSNRPDGVTSN